MIRPQNLEVNIGMILSAVNGTRFAYLPQVHDVLKGELPFETDQHPTEEEVHITRVVLH